MSDQPPASPSDPSPTEHHVQRARSGETDAFDALYDRVSPSLGAWASLRVRGSLRSHVDPLDVVQETWWRALDGFDRYDPERSGFRAWIFQIATRVLLEWNRDRERRARIDPARPENLLGRVPLAMPRDPTSVSQPARLEDSVGELVEVIGALSDDDRDVFIRCGLEGRSSIEAARILGGNPEAVRKRWQRLRQKIDAHAVWREFDPARD